MCPKNPPDKYVKTILYNSQPTMVYSMAGGCFCLLVSRGDVDDPAGDDEACVLDFAYVCLHDGVYGGVVLSCEVPKAIASLDLVLDHVGGGFAAGDLDQFLLIDNHHGFVHHCYYPPFFVCALWRSFLSYTYIYEGLTGMATKR